MAVVILEDIGGLVGLVVEEVGGTGQEQLVYPAGWRASIGLPAFGGQIYPPYGPELTSDQEKEILTQELKDLKEEIKAIEKRLGDLKGSKKIKVEEE